MQLLSICVSATHLYDVWCDADKKKTKNNQNTHTHTGFKITTGLNPDKLWYYKLYNEKTFTCSNSKQINKQTTKTKLLHFGGKTDVRILILKY